MVAYKTNGRRRNRQLRAKDDHGGVSLVGFEEGRRAVGLVLRAPGCYCMWHAPMLMLDRQLQS